MEIIVRAYKHDPDQYCGENHCYEHGVDEPWDHTSYKSCGECNHVFQSKRELLEETNEKMSACSLEPNLLLRAEEVFSCPFCGHDF